METTVKKENNEIFIVPMIFDCQTLIYKKTSKNEWKIIEDYAGEIVKQSFI
jgi:hypothetical protein